jgi:hypothetical protein
MAFKYKPRSLEKIQERATQSGNDFEGFILNQFSMYTPKKGDNWVRVLPPTWDDAEHYGMDVHVHYGIGPNKATVLCNAKMFNEPCCICEARARAERVNDEELAKELKINKRVIAWVIDRKEPSKGPLIWSMPWTVDRDICKISTDRMDGTTYVIDNPYEGYDFTFDKDGEGIGTKYGGFQLARRATSVDAAWLEFIATHPLPETLLLRTYEEVQALYEGSAKTPVAGEAAGINRHRPAAAAQAEPSQEVAQAQPPADEPKPATTIVRRPVGTATAASAPAPSGASPAQSLRERMAARKAAAQG